MMTFDWPFFGLYGSTPGSTSATSSSKTACAACRQGRLGTSGSDGGGEGVRDDEECHLARVSESHGFRAFLLNFGGKAEGDDDG